MHIFILPQWKQHLWKSKECFWKSRSCPIRSPRSFNAQRSSFHTFSSIGRDFTRYQLEKNSRGETKQEVIKLGQLLETGFFFFFFFFFERERKDRNIDATYFAKRMKLVSTSEVDIEGRGWILLCVTKFIEHVYTSAYGVYSLRERESLPRLNFHRKFSNTLIIGSLLSLYLIRNAIFVRIFGVISFPSLVCPPPFQQKLSTFEKRSDQVFHSLSINTFR